MNTYLQNIYTKVKDMFKKHPQTSGAIHDPVHDWGIVVIVSVALLFLSAALNGLLFYKINSGQFSAVEDTYLSSDAVSRTSLKKIVEYYGERQKRFEALKLEKPNVVDPSL